MIFCCVVLLLCAAATSALDKCSARSCSSCASARGCGWNSATATCVTSSLLIDPTLVTKLTTFSPTFTATLVPTIKPTLVPTVNPTIKPTIKPTIDPTFVPTIQPTLIPTLIPTLVPTIKPTLEPTFEPTINPTFIPTLVPTLEPTIKPTLVPTFNPTFNPTIPKFLPKLKRDVDQFDKLTTASKILNSKIGLLDPSKFVLATPAPPTGKPLRVKLITDATQCADYVAPTQEQPAATTTTVADNHDTLPQGHGDTTKMREVDDDHVEKHDSSDEKKHENVDKSSDDGDDRVGDVSDLEGGGGAANQDDEATAGGDSTGLIVGAAVGGVLCLAGLALVVFAIVKRNNDAHYTPPSARSRPAASLPPSTVYGATPRSGGSVDSVGAMPRGYAGASNIEAGHSIGSYGAYSEAGGEYKAIDLAKSDVNNFDNQGYSTQSSLSSGGGLPGLNTQSGNFF